MKRFLLVIRILLFYDFKSFWIIFEILNVENECNLIYIKSVKILFKKKILKGLILCGKYFVYILGVFFYMI